MDLKGKRILILGSTKLIAGIVLKCKELGVYTVVTDNRPLESAPAKAVADNYYDIDFSDLDAVSKVIKEERIDGVLTGFTDSYMIYYVKICKANNLPYYMDDRQLAVATDKTAFKEACVNSGVPVIPGDTADSYESAERIAENLGYPLMLKPVDNSGSRGVIKCESQSELKNAYEYALSFSFSKRVLVEKYLDCNNIAVSYFLADGKMRLSTTDDRMVYKDAESGSSISCYSEYPSRYTQRYIDEVHNKVEKMLSDNGFRNGMLSLQAFVDEDSFYFCEMCYRPSGGQHYALTRRFNGIDQLALLIEYAVTGSCYDSWEYEKETPFFSCNCATLRILGKENKRIAKLEGFDKLSKDERVIRANASLSVGSQIGKSGTTAQVIGSVVYTFSRDEDRMKAAQSIFDQLTVEDEEGNPIAWITLQQ
jgi:biotin carboxylase